MSGPMTAHAAVTQGIERALADLGVDLVGCAPSVLSGHVIKELREAGLLLTPDEDEATVDRVAEAAFGAWHEGCSLMPADPAGAHWRRIARVALRAARGTS